MKKLKFLVMPVGILIAGFGYGSAYAANDPSIKINETEEIYSATAATETTDKTVKFNPETKTLTLDGFTGQSINIKNIEDNITIDLKNKNTFSFIKGKKFGISAEKTELKITGTGKLGAKTTDSDDAGELISSNGFIFASSLVVENGDIDIDVNSEKGCLSTTGTAIFEIGTRKITINSGKLKLKCKAAVMTGELEINGGEIEVDGSVSETAYKSKYFTMNGGKLNEKNGPKIGSGMFFSGVTINGGEISIDGSGQGIAIGKLYEKNEDVRGFKMTGGTLTIKNADWGIHAEGYKNEDSVIEFLGGTTTINANFHIAFIEYQIAHDKKNIVLGEKMTISPSGLTVQKRERDYQGGTEYSLKPTNKNETVIIKEKDDKKTTTDGDTDGAEESESQKENKDTKENDKIPNTPNTGSFIDGSSTAIIVSLAGLPILMTAIYALSRLKSRSDRKIKFEKR